MAYRILHILRIWNGMCAENLGHGCLVQHLLTGCLVQHLLAGWRYMKLLRSFSTLNIAVKRTIVSCTFCGIKLVVLLAVLSSFSRDRISEFLHKKIKTSSIVDNINSWKLSYIPLVISSIKFFLLKMTPKLFLSFPYVIDGKSPKKSPKKTKSYKLI